MKTKLALELEIGKNKGYPLDGTFSASIGFKADGKKRAILTFGEKLLTDAVEFCVKTVLYLTPNLTQGELDDYYRKNP